MTTAPRYLPFPAPDLKLPGPGSRRPAFHVFEKQDVEAVNAALAAGRPLLVRGEPGAGKSQLARAAAVGLKRAFVSEVIDARTEGRDLLWSFDAVRRLADAQVHGAWQRSEDLGDEKAGKVVGKKGDAATEDTLDERNYVAPGPLWWAFDWSGAVGQAGRARVVVPPVAKGCDPANGVVVLLDEIDKADSSVPNGLLGSLGDGRFVAHGKEVSCTGVEPLVVVTTNEERSLPDAFLRRCIVHHMRLPTDKQGLFEWLIRRGRAHFQDLDDEVLGRAAELLWEDRRRFLEMRLAAPGGAEYLDLLRIVAEREEEKAGQLELLKVVADFVLKKHPVEGRG